MDANESVDGNDRRTGRTLRDKTLNMMILSVCSQDDVVNRSVCFVWCTWHWCVLEEMGDGRVESRLALVQAWLRVVWCRSDL